MMHVLFSKCSNSMNSQDVTQCFLFQEAFPGFSRESAAFVPMPHSVQLHLGRLLCILVRSVCLSPDLNKETFEAELVTCQRPLGPRLSTGPAPNGLWGNSVQYTCLQSMFHGDFHQKLR